MHLHWHRRDLRVADNRGFAAGDDDSETAGVFVFDPAVLEHAAPPRVAFMLDALSSLRGTYRERGSDLLLVHGDPVERLPELAATLGATVITWGKDYSGLARKRDAAMRTALDEAGIDRRAVHDSVHHKPGAITTNEGTPYKVFTYFSKKWHDREKRAPVPSPGADELAPAADIDSPLPAVPTLADLGFEQPEATIPTASTEAARDLLEGFCESDIYRYGERRDYPTDDCTSRLSPHLKYGTIGIRDVYEQTEDAKSRAESDQQRESVTEFQDQLAWREFYAQVLWDRPDVVTGNYKTYENPIEWNEDEQLLQRWKAGKTGYPIVDAGMRQLRAEAFMHNRVRMIVASFLTKDLLLDWRHGYEWFRKKLVDHDTANDNGGWQWAASTGTDAQPYFRIFNPMTQGEDYDPDAEYIREYVSELDGVPADVIHSWHDLDDGTRQMHAPEYPAPVVDHSERREQAIAMFERARGDND